MLLLSLLHVLLQVTTIQMFKILGLLCLSTAYSLSVLYMDGIKLGDLQARMRIAQHTPPWIEPLLKHRLVLPRLPSHLPFHLRYTTSLTAKRNTKCGCAC
jgi:hypothetical protein